jgi:mannose/fructose/N-acetylgalactosamine-specific phosphotransferase system component IIB
MHYSQVRDRILPYLYLSPDEKSICRELINSGTKLFCQDVPTAEKKDLKALLDRSF